MIETPKSFDQNVLKIEREKLHVAFSDLMVNPGIRGIMGTKFVKLDYLEYKLLRHLHDHWGKQVSLDLITADVTAEDGRRLQKASWSPIIRRAETKLREATDGKVILENTKGLRRMMLSSKS